MRIKGFPYEYFDGIGCSDNPIENNHNFIQTFLINKKSFVCNYSEPLGLSTILSKIQDFYREKTPTEKEVSEILKNQSIDVKVVFAHVLWIWAYPFGGYDRRKVLNAYFDDDFLSIIKMDLFKKGHGISSIGMAGNSRKSTIPKIINLFCHIVGLELKDRDAAKHSIITFCEAGGCSTYNALCHVCDPNKYFAFTDEGDKDAVIETFKGLIEKEFESSTKNEKISKIHTTLEEYGLPSSSGFYGGFDRMWKKNDELTDDLKKLKYKRAMMLYGPPGTGKTYEAMELAQTLIGHEFADAFLTAADNDKHSILKEFFGKNIFHLQFHVNYTYDDFVAGMVIENGNTQVRKGFIYDVIERANELKKIHDGLPVVVILDETNRTDISRVFGELFSAIEKRGKDIDLSLKIPSKNESGKIIYEPLKLNVPDNVYFIGTMNEIDFSLERIDFALRRRFIWILKTFDEDALKKILENKVGDNFEINKYISLCKKVNDEVKKKLGKEYLIGHSFCAEIANIMDRMDKTYEDARVMLWDISILPTLEAYCGSMDEEEKKKFIIDCANAFALEYKDEKFIPRTKNSNQPTTDTSVNGKNEKTPTVSAAE